MKRRPAVIIVEDEPDVRIILARLLRDLVGEHEIVTPLSAMESLAEFHLRPVPLVFTDYNMPGMDGLQLTQAIKEISPQTQVCLITAYATPDLKRRAEEAGVDHYMPKPPDMARLEAIARGALGEPA